MHLLDQPAENVHHFTEAINSLRDNVLYCRECMMVSDTELCSICSDRTRERSKICVVESVQDVMSIENTSRYHGLYHVLGGIISPINGKGPSDIRIKELVDRLERMRSERLTGGEMEDVEVILALPGDVEGETTSFYIYRQIAPFGVKVTEIARGLAFGDTLQYADSTTLGRSIAARVPFAASRA